MAGMRLDGKVSALDLVLTLSSCFDALETIYDGMFDCLVVASFEVQEAKGSKRPPIAPVKRVLACQI